MSSATHELTTNNKIELSKYRTPELYTSILDLVSLPGAVASLFLWTSGIVLFLMLTTFGILYFTGHLYTDGQFHLEASGIIAIYVILAGGIFGLAVSLVRLLHQSLQDMIAVAQLSLKVSSHIAGDYHGWKSGTIEAPQPREFVQSVYDQVILPTVEEVLVSQLGFLGRIPIVAYESTLGRIVRQVIVRFIPAEAANLGVGEDGEIQKEDSDRFQNSLQI